jgi:hypothetical protein
LVTVTSTVPVPGGAVADIDPDDDAEKLVASAGPNLTLVIELKPLPVIATVVPPTAAPSVGAMLVTMGVGR